MASQIFRGRLSDGEITLLDPGQTPRPLDRESKAAIPPTDRLDRPALRPSRAIFQARNLVHRLLFPFKLITVKDQELSNRLRTLPVLGHLEQVIDSHLFLTN